MPSLDTICEWSIMPDGMPHGKLANSDWLFNGDRHLVASIRSPTDLVKLGIVHDICPIQILTLNYVMGGRMDRAINDTQPNTLRVVANFIRSLGIRRIGCVWPHSPSTLDRLNAEHFKFLEQAFLIESIRSMKEMLQGEFALVLPDSGAEKRYWNDHHSHICFYGDVISCTKHRDMSTGKLSGFSVNAPAVPSHCVIADDLCDGGRTFTGIASKLRDLGAEKVGLIVYHGIFSSGTSLAGIDAIVTTNSFRPLDTTPNFLCMEVLK